MQTLRLCTRLSRSPHYSILSRFYSSQNGIPNGSNGSNGGDGSNGVNGSDGLNGVNEIYGTDGELTDSDRRRLAKKGTIHDEEYIYGSPTNTRNYGKIKVENDVSRILDSVLPKAPKFDDDDQTGMDYKDRMDAKLKKINDMYPADSEEREKAIVTAHNQLAEEIKTELIREFEFDPIEHKKAQNRANLGAVATTAYTIPGIDPKNKQDSAPREDTSGGFAFGSINFASSAEGEGEGEEGERTYVVGHHGQKLKIPKKQDIYVVDRPLDPKN